jgi:hypothetical protein
MMDAKSSLTSMPDSMLTVVSKAGIHNRARGLTTAFSQSDAGDVEYWVQYFSIPSKNIGNDRAKHADKYARARFCGMSRTTKSV